MKEGAKSRAKACDTSSRRSNIETRKTQLSFDPIGDWTVEAKVAPEDNRKKEIIKNK